MFSLIALLIPADAQVLKQSRSLSAENAEAVTDETPAACFWGKTDLHNDGIKAAEDYNIVEARPGVPNAVKCNEYCTQYSTCMFWTWLSSKNSCYFLSHKGEMVPSEEATSGARGSKDCNAGQPQSPPQSGNQDCPSGYTAYDSGRAPTGYLYESKDTNATECHCDLAKESMCKAVIHGVPSGSEKGTCRFYNNDRGDRDIKDIDLTDFESTTFLCRDDSVHETVNAPVVTDAPEVNAPVVTDAPEGSWVKCADERKQVKKKGTRSNCYCNGRVRYGDAATNAWTAEKNTSFGFSCATHFFREDPAVGVEKTCQCYVETVDEEDKKQVGNCLRTQWWRNKDQTCATFKENGRCDKSKSAEAAAACCPDTCRIK